MNHFLKRILYFLIVPIIFFLILCVIAATYIPKSSYYKIEPMITDIYVGDSHIQKAVVDSLLNNSQNIGMLAESFYFSYYRLKKIFESDNNIETVYLGFSYHNLSDYNDDFVYGKNSYSTSPKYFYLLTLNEQKKLLYYNRNHLQSYIKSLIKNLYKPILNNTKFGGYSNNFKSTKSNKSIMDKRINYQFYTDKKVNEFSHLNLFYLEEIIKLSEKYKFDLKILNTPMDSYYQEKIPITYINKYDDIINKFNLKLINFNNLIFDETCYIPDGDHLSEIGAFKMTTELIKIQNHAKELK